MGEEGEEMVIVCEAGGEIKQMKRNDTLIQLLELLIGILIAFLIISKVLGEQTWIAWILAIGFVFYKVRKVGWF